MSDLRVLLALATSTGGVGAHVRSLADRVPTAGVACPAATQEVFGFPSWLQWEVGNRLRPSRDAKALRVLRHHASDYDVVHAHGLRAGALAVLAVRTPVVVTLHNQVGGRLGAALERLVARRASVVLAASADLAERARALGGRDVRFVPVAAPALAPPVGDPGLGNPLVLAVGRLHPQKGYDVLLRALPLLGEAVVAVAGDGPLEAQLRAAAPEVRWLGRRTDRADLYAAADVVVLPSQWEARSLVAQEAMRAGRPLVATDVGGMAELVGDGAVLVPAGDAPALAHAVRRLLDDPSAAAALAGRARAVAATWPDEDAVAATLRAVYAEVAR
ncbi:MAG TPA: glycosyltransferase family 4 protein [Mycobacteriales bacterium]|nr:glycosyltransferase family 4 protein [Mycobacteriales bacterium]